MYTFYVAQGEQRWHMVQCTSPSVRCTIMGHFRVTCPSLCAYLLFLQPSHVSNHQCAPKRNPCATHQSPFEGSSGPLSDLSGAGPSLSVGSKHNQPARQHKIKTSCPLTNVSAMLLLFSWVVKIGT